jgi:hypothetical protein
VHTTLLALLNSNWAAVGTTEEWSAALATNKALQGSDLGSSAAAGSARVALA